MPGTSAPPQTETIELGRLGLSPLTVVVIYPAFAIYENIVSILEQLDEMFYEHGFALEPTIADITEYAKREFDLDITITKEEN